MVALRNAATGFAHTDWITVAESNGTMSYSTAGVPAGTYILTARLYYRGDDGLTRGYSLIDDLEQVIPSLTVTLTGDEAPMLALRLNGDVCATP
jgi:hypothetical protein